MIPKAKFPILVIHGGAGKKNQKNHNQVAEALRQIVVAGFQILERGGSAVAAVTKAVSLLEDNPLFNAGKGSKIQSDGKIRMSAALMDGQKLKFSGCINVTGVKNPILLAHQLQKEQYRVLSEVGAKRFAREKKLKFSSPYTAENIREWKLKKKKKFGTVGAVAVDQKGHLAAATSTGGRGFEYPHRVSDSPTVAGNYANAVCAVSTTGIGEEIVDHAVAATICNLVENGISLKQAVTYIVRSAKKRGSHFGFISVTKKGEILAAMTTEHLTWAYKTKNKICIFP